MAQEFDLVVIGAGQAASPLVEGLKEKGWSTAVAERSSPGGSCVNFGCTPTKAVVWAARVQHLAETAGRYGLTIRAKKPDFRAVMENARAIVAQSVANVRSEFGDNPKLLAGQARIDRRDGDRIVLHVGDEEIRTRKLVLNVGTQSIIPPIEGLSEVNCLTSENWIESDDLPQRLVILGGGYIAAEMSQFFRRMGAEVTVVEKGPQLLAREDSEVGDAVCNVLEKEGIRLLYKRNLQRVVKGNDGLRLHLADDEVLECDRLFVAVGRKPNTDALGLEALGIEIDEKGFIVVDEHSRTTAADVYAAGDVRGGAMFTHTAWDDGRVILTDLVGGERPTTDRVVPYAIFTDPQLGRVGLGEKQAKEKGIDFEIRRFDLKHNGIAQATRQTEGFVKVLISGEKILGATVLAPEGADLAQLFSVFVACGISAVEFRKLLVTHPTWAEAAQSAIL